jgi:hypothetical protein
MPDSRSEINRYSLALNVWETATESGQGNYAQQKGGLSHVPKIDISGGRNVCGLPRIRDSLSHAEWLAENRTRKHRERSMGL